ncbi:MAG TPA: SRPBCC family protein [Elusimicrobiota bacterium]|nr:SRPBCC family protein [Elusimicrobiota bacterium]
MTTKTKTETFVYATFIRTTPEKLWEALTSGDFSEKYWMGFRIELEQRVGGRVRILPPKGTESKFGDHAGEVLACEKPRTLTYTWNVKDAPELAARRDGLSRVTYELTPMGGEVKLRVIHENLLPEDIVADPGTFKGVNNGWPAVMSSLKSLLETGEAIAFAPPKEWKSC